MSFGCILLLVMEQHFGMAVVACENDMHELVTFATYSRASLVNRLRHPHLGRNMAMARFTTALVSVA